jgi:hypothetical protein
MKIRLLTTSLLLAATVSSATLAAPAITRVNPLGIQAGSESTITIQGSGFLPEPRLIASFPIEKQELQPGAAANQVVFKVTVPAHIPSGIHAIRIVSSTGNSNLTAIAVDRLAQQDFSDQLDSLPRAVNGQLAGGQILKTTFTGKKGQRVVVDVEAQRLGSNLRPVIRVLDERGTQVAWSPPKPLLLGDARCEFTLPGDGTYTIQLHDLLYKGPQPGFFRMKVGALEYVDFVFPVGAQRGEQVSVQLLSASPGLPEMVDLTTGTGSVQQLSIGTEGLFGGSRPFVVLSDHLEVIEQQLDGDAIQQVAAAPVAINGRLTEVGGRDRYQLAVTPGSTLRFDVVAQRIGSAIDGVLTIKDPGGKQIGRNDDRGGTLDPGLDLTVPAGVEQVIVEFESLDRRAGPAHIYRIKIVDLGQADFQIQLATDHFSVPAGASQAMKLQITRRGYDGPIELSGDGFPEGVILSGTTIPAGSNNAVIAISSNSSDWIDFPLRIVGRGNEGNIVRLATATTTDKWRNRSWLRDNTVLSSSAAPPVTASWDDAAADTVLLQGTYQVLNVNLPRTEGVAGNVRLSLLTDQVIPKKKIKKDKKDVMVDDLDRALRLEQPPMVPADQAHAEATLWVPVDLPIRNWNLSVVAELLAADNKTVISSVTTPVVTLPARVPIKIALEGEATLTALAGDGETGHLKGTLQREEGYQLPATVTLRGLPEGYPAPTVEVAGDVITFDLEVRFPAGTKPMELKEIQLVATVTPDPKREAVIFSSNVIPLTVNVVAP